MQLVSIINSQPGYNMSKDPIVRIFSEKDSSVLLEGTIAEAMPSFIGHGLGKEVRKYLIVALRKDRTFELLAGAENGRYNMNRPALCFYTYPDGAKKGREMTPDYDIGYLHMIAWAYLDQKVKTHVEEHKGVLVFNKVGHFTKRTPSGILDRWPDVFLAHQGYGPTKETRRFKRGKLYLPK